MRRNGRALAESLTLHGLLVGAMLFMATVLTPPPKPIRLDFSLAQPAPAPQPTAAPQKTAVAAAPAPPEAVPVPAASQPEPATLLQKLAPAATKVKRAIPQATPEPQPTREQSPAAVAETPAATEATSAPVATVADPAVTKALAIPADEAYRKANFTAIRDSILGKLHYPMLARRRGWSGQVELAFTITPDGSVRDLRILTSSGYPLLDDEALSAIRETAPFSPPPQVAATVTMPITFRLN